MNSDQLQNSIYSRAFAILLPREEQQELTPQDLNISDFYVNFFRQDTSFHIDLDYKRFYENLTSIFENEDQIIQIRSILLTFHFRHVFDLIPIFEYIITEDLIRKQSSLYDADTEESFFISDSRYFNETFFHEIGAHPPLMRNFIEIIKSFVKKDTLKYEKLYPIINNVILANENSIVPIDPKELDFMDVSDVADHKDKIRETFPIILPFSIKYEEYTDYSPDIPTLKIKVKRDNVFDSVLLLDQRSEVDFYFKVEFLGEEGIDCTGLTKDYIDLAFLDIVKPERDLFELKNDFYWFKYHKSVTPNLKTHYKCVGKLLALVVLNNRTIPIRFPPYFYKKLLHRDITFADINHFDPLLFNGFESLFNRHVTEADDVPYVYPDPKGEYEIDLRDFSRHDDDVFEYTPLIVTDANKADFFMRTAEWIFNQSIKEEFDAFEEGYQAVNTNSMLYTSFRLDEIDRIISGDPHRDWDALKETARYINCSSTHQVIQWFWRFFFELSEEKKIEAVKFITGSSSVPVQGMGSLRIALELVGKSNLYPAAHTCFNRLDLPEYNSYEELSRYLSEAFPNLEYGRA